jgi:hypothetical protein
MEWRWEREGAFEWVEGKCLSFGVEALWDKNK